MDISPVKLKDTYTYRIKATWFHYIHIKFVAKLTIFLLPTKSRWKIPICSIFQHIPIVVHLPCCASTESLESDDCRLSLLMKYYVIYVKMLKNWVKFNFSWTHNITSFYSQKRIFKSLYITSLFLSITVVNFLFSGQIWLSASVFTGSFAFWRIPYLHKWLIKRESLGNTQ